MGSTHPAATSRTNLAAALALFLDGFQRRRRHKATHSLFTEESEMMGGPAVL